jgi:hypothetical protein
MVKLTYILTQGGKGWMMSVSKSLSTSSNFLPSTHYLLTYLLTRFHPTSFINLVSTVPEEGWAHLGWMGPGCTNGPGAYL